MKKCPKCGAEMPDDAKFCSACGASILPEPEVEVIPPTGSEPKSESKQEKSGSRWRAAQNKQKKYEYNEHVRRKRNFITAGTILLIAGSILTVLSIVFFVVDVINLASNNEPSVGDTLGVVFFSMGMSIGIILLLASIPLIVVANAVFGKKAENRERAIREYEGR